MEVQGLALLPHSMRVLALNPPEAEPFCVHSSLYHKLKKKRNWKIGDDIEALQ